MGSGSLELSTAKCCAYSECELFQKLTWNVPFKLEPDFYGPETTMKISKLIPDAKGIRFPGICKRLIPMPGRTRCRNKHNQSLHQEHGPDTLHLSSLSSWWK